jgi:hypothetical protein
VGAALVAKEEVEYPYKLLLADINFWRLCLISIVAINVFPEPVSNIAITFLLHASVKIVFWKLRGFSCGKG